MPNDWTGIVYGAIALIVTLGIAYSVKLVKGAVTPAVSSLASIDQVKTYVALGFSAIVAFAFLFCMGAMFFLSYKNPAANISVWLNICLTCLGYIVGILAGLFGIAKS